MNIPDYTGAGVYALINTTNGKMYIGSSANIRHRLITHKSQMKHLRYNKEMNEDVKRGHEFKVEILEKVSEDTPIIELFQKEQAYIRSHNVCGKLYNKSHPSSMCYNLNANSPRFKPISSVGIAAKPKQDAC